MPKISRRRFLTHALGAGLVGASSLGVYRAFVPTLPKISVDYPGKEMGHALRDGALRLGTEEMAQLPELRVKTLIIGSGAAALSAAWQLSKHGANDYLVLDGLERGGNTRGETRHGVDYPTGAHYLPLPSAESAHIRELLADVGLFDGKQYDERALLHVPGERLYYQNHWQSGLLPEHSADGERFFAHMATLSQQRGADGKRWFAIPLAAASADAQRQKLDKITFAAWLQQNGYTSPELTWYADYCCRDDYGQGAAQVSAYAGLHYFCARGHENESTSHTVLTWGNGLHSLAEKMRTFCRLQNADGFDVCSALLHTAQKRPVSVHAFALSIKEQPDNITVLAQDAHGRRVRIVANHAVCAMPLYIAARVVNNIRSFGFEPSKHLPEYAPWLIGNFILQGMPPETNGAPLSWDNVLYQGKGLGYVLATHQQIWRAPPPVTSFTAYTVLNHDTPDKVRRQLLNATPQELYNIAAAELEQIYGISLRRRVIEARLTVRAHAMAVPKTAYLQNDGLHALQNANGRLRFAHSDLSGYSIFEEACFWGRKAALEILGK